MLVKEIMSGTVQWVEPDTTIYDAAGKMREFNVGALPVKGKDGLAGIVTDRDISCRCVAEGWDPATAAVKEAMTKDLTWCFDDVRVDEAARTMEAKRVRRLPVLNHQDELVGIVTASDLERCASQKIFQDPTGFKVLTRHGNPFSRWVRCV
jgi:CBS domain-containing protein